jgi:hypothetical protein
MQDSMHWQKTAFIATGHAPATAAFDPVEGSFSGLGGSFGG